MSDTAAIRPEERFDEATVGDFLTASVPGFEGPIAFEQFPGGKANLTYLARDRNGVELVLRRPPLGDLAPGSHDMAREYRVLSVLWESYDKAPRAVAFCADEAVMEKPFFAMERRRGIVVRDQWPFADLDKRRRAAETLVDAVAELHAVDFAAGGLSDLGKPEGFVARQVAGWTDRWHRAKTRDLADMEAVAEGLIIVPAPQAVALIHNDFKLDNTMIDETGTVHSVFDWDMATLGDPLVDLGTAIAYWADPEAPTYGVFGAVAAEMAPYLSKADVADRYATATGLDLSALPFYLALAHFRIAVIIEQIYARYLAGQTSDDRFADLGVLVPPLAAEARRALGV